jgi:hypothetical protein
VVYDLVGHGYVSAGMKHFCARFLSQDGKKMYDYDGMKHDGHAVPNNAAIKGSLTGSLSSMTVPMGFRLETLVYRLRGGIAAQRAFTMEQVTRAQKIGLEFEASVTTIPLRPIFTRPNTRVVERRDMFWLPEDSPNTHGRTDYVALPPPKTPSPRKKGKLPAPSSRPDSPKSADSSPSPADVQTEFNGVAARTPSPIHRGLPDAPPSPWRINCLACGKISDCATDADGNTIQCNACKDWSHLVCVDAKDPNLAVDSLDDLEWICPDCVLSTGRTSWNPNL